MKYEIREIVYKQYNKNIPVEVSYAIFEIATGNRITPEVDVNGANLKRMCAEMNAGTLTL